MRRAVERERSERGIPVTRSRKQMAPNGGYFFWGGCKGIEPIGVSSVKKRACGRLRNGRGEI